MLQYVFEMRVDGVTILSEVNSKATTINNIKVRLSSNQFSAFPGFIYSERLTFCSMDIFQNKVLVIFLYLAEICPFNQEHI